MAYLPRILCNHSDLFGHCKYLLVIFVPIVYLNVYFVQAPVFSGDSKFENLRRLSRTNPVIKLTNSNEFHKYLISLPRDYSAFVLFTERRRTCPDCWHAKRNLEAIAQHYVKNLWKPRMFFFMIAREEVPHLFVKVTISSVPSFGHIIRFNLCICSSKLRNHPHSSIFHPRANYLGFLSWKTLKKDCFGCPKS